MSSNVSRRGVLKASVAAAAVGAIPVKSLAEPTVQDGLGSKMSESTAKLYKAQIDQGRANSVERLKTPLPEGSEPYFLIQPVPFAPVADRGGKK